MLGYEPHELEGRHVETLLGVAGRIFFQTHLYPIARLHGRVEEVFVLFRHKNGTDVGALINALRRNVGGQALTDCAIMEVRERRKYEDALLRAKQAAETATATAENRSRELEIANEKLEQQAVELELQQQQLQDQATDLEQARVAAEDANHAKSQ